MNQITKDQALTAINNGEFGDELLLAAEKVAIILTQSWCPQWHAMKQFVTGFPGARIFVLEYDRTDYFDQFREFKERTLGNDQIPYVRYYDHGILVAESNAVTEEVFRQNLEK